MSLAHVENEENPRNNYERGDWFTLFSTFSIPGQAQAGDFLGGGLSAHCHTIKGDDLDICSSNQTKNSAC